MALVLFIEIPVSAIVDVPEDFYSDSNIQFYNPNACEPAGNGAVTNSDANLGAKLKEIADKSKDKMAISVIPLEGSVDDVTSVRGAYQMPTRSSYKLYTAYATLRAIEDGSVNWSTRVTNPDTTGNPGSSGGTVEQMLEKMIVNSDNGAAAALRLNPTIGSPEKVTSMLKKSLGLSNKTVMGGGDAGSAKGSNSKSTANDFATFLYKLHNKDLPGVSEGSNYTKLLGYMSRATTDNVSARQGIAAGAGGSKVYDKPGWGSDATNDVGIVELDGNPFVLSILTANGSSNWSLISSATKDIVDSIKEKGLGSASESGDASPPESCACSEVSAGSAGSVASPTASKVPSGFSVGKSALKLVEKNAYAYKAAEEATGVPAAFIAALHYRENSLSTSWPSNGQGIYQWYERAGQYPSGGNATKKQFIDGSIEIAKDKIVKDKAKIAASKTGIKFSEKKEDVAEAFKDPKFVKALLFAYNGWADVYAEQAKKLGYRNQPWEGSPYVMNKWDKPRNGTKASNPSKWGQIKVDNGPMEYPANDQPGGWMLFIEFGGSVSGGTDNCGQSTSGGDVVEVAKREYQNNKGKREYEGSIKHYTTGREEPWCADFVSWVYKSAGKPFTGGGAGGWQYPAVVTLKDYFDNKHEFFKPGEKEPQPGDVAFYIGAETPDGGSAQHVNIVIEVNGNKMTTIGGNESDQIMRSEREIKLGSQSLAGFGRFKQ